VLGAFEQGEAKFLVGTQMVTKGHDFPNVTLCAAVSADALLNMPDFRSAERTFQVLTQVAGRAGRGDRPGQAFFQTLHPEHYAVVCAARQDYVRFYETELEQRRALAYPPFSRLALVRIMARDPGLCQRVGEAVKQQLGEKVQAIGPVPAFRKKRRENHIFLLLLRARPGMGFSRVLSRSAFEFPRIRVDIDIDPVQVA
jgi:primosomal protein N' (replication factor Y)